MRCERFDLVLEAIESEGDWVTNRVIPGIPEVGPPVRSRRLGRAVAAPVRPGLGAPSGAGPAWSGRRSPMDLPKCEHGGICAAENQILRPGSGCLPRLGQHLGSIADTRAIGSFGLTR